MFVESHWSVLKREHMRRFNQARLDLLLWMITNRHCGDPQLKFDRQIIGVSEVPRWEQKFVAQWNEHIQKFFVPGRGPRVYGTSLASWVCGCPDFLGGQFLVCKHLVAHQAKASACNIGFIANRDYMIVRHDQSLYIRFLNVSICQTSNEIVSLTTIFF